MSLQAANEIEEFRQRIRGNEVIVHDTIHAGSTILNDDDTFGFCYFDYCQDYNDFRENASATLKRYKEQNNSLDPQDFRDDLLHYSIIPWISFTSVSHPRKFGQENLGTGP